MKTKKSIALTAVAISGGLLSSQANATSALSFSDLGSGAELRANLLQNNVQLASAIELSCGEKEGKSTEHKCGEGKCGEKTKEGKTTEHKCGEGKCGEGKCGEKSKEEKTKEGKTTEHKCGEGKCGEK